MFSIITMASSTTNPVEIVSAISVRLLRLKPAKYIATHVPISDSGTATAGIQVVDSRRRKRKITSTTSATVRPSSSCTSAMDARMVVVRSVSTETWTAGGSVAESVGSSALMRSTTSIVFAPGWRCTLTITAGVVFIHAAWCASSTLSTTWATSDSRTGAPLR